MVGYDKFVSKRSKHPHGVQHGFFGGLNVHSPKWVSKHLYTFKGVPNIFIYIQRVSKHPHSQGFQTSIYVKGFPNIHIPEWVSKYPHSKGFPNILIPKWVSKHPHSKGFQTSTFPMSLHGSKDPHEFPTSTPFQANMVHQ